MKRDNSIISVKFQELLEVLEAAMNYEDRTVKTEYASVSESVSNHNKKEKKRREEFFRESMRKILV